MQGVGPQLLREDDETMAAIAEALIDAAAALERAVEFVVSTYASEVRKACVGAVALLELFGIVAGGWQMARAAWVAKQRLDEGGANVGFHTAKLHTDRFYADRVLSRASGLAHAVVRGADTALAIDQAQL
jgi:hypothetical protein